ncbi:hypothetical protein KRP22_004570 [Phytophthora ramorum]|nr:Secreted RxLR effector protein 78 [Phytophthora ramorum]
MARSQLIAVTEEEAREEHLVRTAQWLERSMEQIRWNYKRVSNWERDQTISTISRLNGKEFTREMTIVDRFGSEWKPILGKEHNEIKSEAMEAEFDAFVTIPAERKVTEQGNQLLMRPITTDEVIEAFDALNRHKAAGPDGLNNDLFKDAQALLVPAMVAIGNELLKGGEPPKSFLEGLIIPLRKKGDSDNAMDYRPISLLQTGYKVYTKIIASRVQKVMGRTIGESQQGFVHGRQMMKTVMMMLAMLTTAKQEPDLAALESRVILMLDFKKAYDTVARAFLFLVLEKFGFSNAFGVMIRKLHQGTTARFLINGSLSEPLDIVSGIRQGCQLAPLLFLLAAEILALAIQQDRQIKGLRVPGTPAAEHTFSAFVDDSTVFLEKASMLTRVMEIVDVFGRLSGLRNQPTKSKLIFLNTTVKLKKYQEIPVLQHGETVRYLGFAVGTGELTDPNWAIRIRNVQRRLATATNLATSVELRVLILNVIMLPAVLFTAAAFEPPDWAEKQLQNLQKQFLWHHATSAESARHKLNPAIVYLPKQAGGLGLASIAIACKVQRAKHALQWLTQRGDRYSSAWRAWAFREAAQDWEQGISPHPISVRRPARGLRTPGNTLQQLIGSWIGPNEMPNTEAAHQQDQEFDILMTGAISWMRADEWTLELPRRLTQRVMQQTKVETAFWPVYQWADNPWIRDQQGKTLNPQKFNRIRPWAEAPLAAQAPAVGHSNPDEFTEN